MLGRKSAATWPWLLRLDRPARAPKQLRWPRKTCGLLLALKPS